MDAGLPYPPVRGPSGLLKRAPVALGAVTKDHGWPSGCLWPARMVYPAVGAFASPCEGRVGRLDQVLASGCSRRFRAAPLLDRTFGAMCRHLPSWLC